jgi:hypothetical protein
LAFAQVRAPALPIFMAGQVVFQALLFGVHVLTGRRWKDGNIVGGPCEPLILRT